MLAGFRKILFSLSVVNSLPDSKLSMLMLKRLLRRYDRSKNPATRGILDGAFCCPGKTKNIPLYW
jgi:hypothetical protein